MTLVDEIARAICLAHGVNASRVATGCSTDVLWEGDAQAALSAILRHLREPSEGMKAALCDALFAMKSHDELNTTILRALADHLEGKG